LRKTRWNHLTKPYPSDVNQPSIFWVPAWHPEFRRSGSPEFWVIWPGNHGFVNHNWLVGKQPLWKIWVRQLGWCHSQYKWKNNPNVPNHQPDNVPERAHREETTDNLRWIATPDKKEPHECVQDAGLQDMQVLIDTFDNRTSKSSAGHENDQPCRIFTPNNHPVL